MHGRNPWQPLLILRGSRFFLPWAWSLSALLGAARLLPAQEAAAPPAPSSPGDSTRLLAQPGRKQAAELFLGPADLGLLPNKRRNLADLTRSVASVNSYPELGAPHLVTGFGARPTRTSLTLDALGGNLLYFGEAAGSWLLPYNVSLVALDRVDLDLTGFEVERAGAGPAIRLASIGGEPRPRAVFLMQRDEALTAADFREAEMGDFRVDQFGLALGGRLLTDRIRYALVLDRMKGKRQTGFSSPDTALLPKFDVVRFEQILKNNYDMQEHVNLTLNDAGRPDGFVRTDRDLDHRASFGRLDWSIASGHRLSLLTSVLRFEEGNRDVNAGEALTHAGVWGNRVVSVGGVLESRLGARVRNTLRLQWAGEEHFRRPTREAGFIPALTVFLVDSLPLSFGADQELFRYAFEETRLEAADAVTFTLGRHGMKVGTGNVLWHVDHQFWPGGAGVYTYRGLNDLEQGRVHEYERLARPCAVPLEKNYHGDLALCREYDVPGADFGGLDWALFAQDEWRISDEFRLTGGVRWQGTSYQGRPAEKPDLERVFGIQTDMLPRLSGLSPRLSFLYDRGGEQRQVVRGGVGIFHDRVPAFLAGNVFLSERPLRLVQCFGQAAPRYHTGEVLGRPPFGGARGQNNPMACADGTVSDIPPDHTVFGKDFRLPRTLRGHLGLERALGASTRLGLDVVYGRTTNDYTVADLNLGPIRYRIPAENDRPTFAPLDTAGLEPGTRVRVYEPIHPAGGWQYRHQQFGHVFANVSTGQAESRVLLLELEQKLGRNAAVDVGYAWTRVYDNSSFSCCTSLEGFAGSGVWPRVAGSGHKDPLNLPYEGDLLPRLPTAGNPNFLGGPGDEEEGTWAPSSFERRHVVAARFMARLPWQLRLAGVWRSQSGLPWTPVAFGDLNNDGMVLNDRAMISTDLLFWRPDDPDRLAAALDGHKCLRDQLGRIARRNSCRNPWWHSLDLRLSKVVPAGSDHALEVTIDLFNVLHGLNRGWGRYLQVRPREQILLKAIGFDEAAEKTIYGVNYYPQRPPGQRGFGDLSPVAGDDAYQFQAQIGVSFYF
ncbi:MAG: TonB-dependent receptor [Gemmatimonadetes bacterium]|nr:TonB-dependent receptor [Gemmatimonadota bacterium]